MNAHATMAYHKTALTEMKVLNVLQNPEALY